MSKRKAQVPLERKLKKMEVEPRGWRETEEAANEELRRTLNYVLYRKNIGRGETVGQAIKQYITQLNKELKPDDPLLLLAEKVRQNDARRGICNLPKIGEKPSQEELHQILEGCRTASNAERANALLYYDQLRNTFERMRQSLEEKKQDAPLFGQELSREELTPTTYPTWEEIDYVMEEPEGDPCEYWERPTLQLSDLSKCQEAWHRRRSFAQNFWLA
jgi:hypothetical protein